MSKKAREIVAAVEDLLRRGIVGRPSSSPTASGSRVARVAAEELVEALRRPE
ncbi:MAG: hypothetical protein O7A04_08290 [Acidobacteria bacterium]|nr:hypothetical protein [Acidobacteriota bacterium]